MSERIDKEMVTRGLVQTRSQARMLIEQGDVYCNDKLVKKPGANVKDSDSIEIKDRKLFVSRGAYKLEKALVQFDVDPKDYVCADIGASTGGFTQLLLQRGASKVYAVDVGHDQLAPILKDDVKVINLEGTNIKYPLSLDEKVDLCVIDLSFISLKLVLKNIFDLLKEDGRVIALFKPQFEVGKARIGKNGLVSGKDREDVVAEFELWLEQNSYHFQSKTESPIKGKTGNIEYLYFFSRC